jgi:hypothetical protein
MQEAGCRSSCSLHAFGMVLRRRGEMFQVSARSVALRCCCCDTRKALQGRGLDDGDRIRWSAEVVGEDEQARCGDLHATRVPESRYTNTPYVITYQEMKISSFTI